MEGERLGGFSAHEEHRYATDNDKTANPQVKGFTTWVIHGGWRPKEGGGLPIKGHSLEESKDIIREAMLAYRSVCGNPSGDEWVFDVKMRFSAGENKGAEKC